MMLATRDAIGLWLCYGTYEPLGCDLCGQGSDNNHKDVYKSVFLLALGVYSCRSLSSLGANCV